jgi:hypothetical protein
MEAFKVWKQIKEKNMKYLEKNLTYKDKKKMLEPGCQK